MVTRKIAMRIETWDREPLEGQERIIGRAKGMGGPMSGGDEAAEPDFGATDKTTGAALIGPMAHVRLAHPTANDVPSCCGVATTPWTAPTGWDSWRPGCSSSPSSVTRVGRSSRSNARWPGPTNDLLRVHRSRRLRPLRLSGRCRRQ